MSDFRARMPRPRHWSRDEHVLAFNLYCKIPFGTIHMGNPKIIELADLLHRSAGAVSYKLANFARLDPTLQSRGIRGLAHGAKGEEEVWQEFATNGEKLAYESEKLLAEHTGTPLARIGGDRRERTACRRDRSGSLDKDSRQPTLFPRRCSRGLQLSMLCQRAGGASHCL